MTYVISYVRVSGHGQLDGTGFDRQDEVINRFCASKGWEVQFSAPERGISGAADVEHREALWCAIADLEKIGDPEKVIVVEDSKRWARNVLVGEILLNRCREIGVRVWSAAEGIDMTVDESDPHATMIRQLFSVLAQWDKAVTVQRLRISRQIRRKSGKTATRGGQAGVEGKKPYGTHPAEKHGLRTILTLHASGWQAAAIANELNHQGIRSRSGKPWRRSVVRKIITNTRNREFVPEFVA